MASATSTTTGSAYSWPPTADAPTPDAPSRSSHDHPQRRRAGKGTFESMDLAYPDPELTDGVVRLRPWSEDDLDCVREAATDPRISAGTTVPAVFTPEEGLAFIGRQRQRI